MPRAGIRRLFHARKAVREKETLVSRLNRARSVQCRTMAAQRDQVIVTTLSTTWRRSRTFWRCGRRMPRGVVRRAVKGQIGAARVGFVTTNM